MTSKIAKGKIRINNRESHTRSIYLPSEITRSPDFFYRLDEVNVPCVMKIDGRRLIVARTESDLLEDIKESEKHGRYNSYYGEYDGD